jgi:hypothetical protein
MTLERSVLILQAAIPERSNCGLHGIVNMPAA